MKSYIQDLEIFCKKASDVPTGGAPLVFELIHGVKHGSDMFKKELPLAKFGLNDPYLIYFIEIWDGQKCKFRGYCNHDPKKGINLMETEISSELMLSIFMAGMAYEAIMRKKLIAP